MFKYNNCRKGETLPSENEVKETERDKTTFISIISHFVPGFCGYSDNKFDWDV